MIELMNETVFWVITVVVFMAIAAFVAFGNKLLSAIINYITNFIKWQRFRKKDNFEDFDDYED